VSATVMRVTAIHAQTEPKRLDRFARHAEKQGRQTITGRLHRRFRQKPSASATEDTTRGKKHLAGARIQAIFTSNDTPLGECRINYLAVLLSNLGKTLVQKSD
jgi:hypothetical protein